MARVVIYRKSGNSQSYNVTRLNTILLLYKNACEDSKKVLEFNTSDGTSVSMPTNSIDRIEGNE